MYQKDNLWSIRKGLHFYFVTSALKAKKECMKRGKKGKRKPSNPHQTTGSVQKKRKTKRDTKAARRAKPAYISAAEERDAKGRNLKQRKQYP